MELASVLSTQLRDAIEHGDRDLAVESVNRLVNLRAKLYIAVDERSINKGTRVKVHVEDRDTDAGCVFIYVSPSMSIRLLKEKVYMALGFPPEVQQWIIGKCLASDNNILCDLVDVVDGITLTLYLTTAFAAGLSRKGFGDNAHEKLMKNAIYGLDSSIREEPLQSSSSPKTPAASQRPLPKVPESSKNEHLTLVAGRPLPNPPKSEAHLKRVSSQSLKASVPVTHQLSAVSNQNPQYCSSQGECIPINHVSSARKQLRISEKITVVKPSSTGVGTASNQPHVNRAGPWTCTRCTYGENEPALETCSLCDAPRNYVNTA